MAMGLRDNDVMTGVRNNGRRSGKRCFCLDVILLLLLLAFNCADRRNRKREREMERLRCYNY